MVHTNVLKALKVWQYAVSMERAKENDVVAEIDYVINATCV